MTLKSITLYYTDAHAATIERHMMNIIQENYPVGVFQVNDGELKSSLHTAGCTDCTIEVWDIIPGYSYVGRHRPDQVRDETT